MGRNPKQLSEVAIDYPRIAVLTKIAPFDAYRSSQSSTGEIHSRDAEGCGGMVHVDNPAVPRTRGAEN